MDNEVVGTLEQVAKRLEFDIKQFQANWETDPILAYVALRDLSIAADMLSGVAFANCEGGLGNPKELVAKYEKLAIACGVGLVEVN